jgi:hypothetical protein
LFSQYLGKANELKSNLEKDKINIGLASELEDDKFETVSDSYITYKMKL